MGEWTVTDEAVNALNNMATELNEKAAEILQEVLTLIECFEDNKDGLGAHSEDILNLLKELRETTDEANEPVKKLVKKLVKAAAIRKAHIDTSVYQQQKGRSR